jgi:hypothetical protein
MSFDHILRQYATRSVPAMQRTFHAIERRELLVLCALVAVAASISIPAPFVGLGILGVVGGIGLMAVFIRHPQLWLYCFIVSLIVWFPQKGEATESVTGVEYGLVAFYLGGLAVWFTVMLFVRRVTVLRNLGDWLLASALVLSVFNLGIALANDVPLIEWAREWLLLVFALYYFPLREHFRTNREIVTLCTVLGLTMTVVGAMTLQKYVAASTNAAYAWQILSSRMNSNNNMSVVLSLFAIMAVLYMTNLRGRLIALAAAAFFATLTIVSFARMFILATGVGIVGTLLLMDTRRLVNAGLYAAAIGFIFFAGVSVVFQDKAEIALKVLGARIGSTSKGTKDISIRERIAESREVGQHILANPLGGEGFGSTFSFYDPILNTTAHPQFIHNGFLYLPFKLGLPLCLLLYAWYSHYLARAYLCARGATVPFDRILALGALGSLLALILINLTSNLFKARDAFVMLSFAMAFICTVESRIISESQQRHFNSQATTLGFWTLGAMTLGALVFFFWQVR